MPTKEWTQECKSCQGTGLYVGMAESGGAEIVCHTCNSTGEQKMHFEFTEFTGRKTRSGVTHVYRCNPGIFVDDKGTVPGGVSLQEWLQKPESVNEVGKEMREHTCPAWWYQTADYKKKPDCSEHGFGVFSKCPCFPQKQVCWERWDAQYREPL